MKARDRLLAALAAGVIFGIGLGISGMTRPTKVLAFLDVAGAGTAAARQVAHADEALRQLAHDPAHRGRMESRREIRPGSEFVLLHDSQRLSAAVCIGLVRTLSCQRVRPNITTCPIKTGQIVFRKLNSSQVVTN